MSNRHVKCNMSKMELLIFPPHCHFLPILLYLVFPSQLMTTPSIFVLFPGSLETPLAPPIFISIDSSTNPIICSHHLHSEHLGPNYLVQSHLDCYTGPLAGLSASGKTGFYNTHIYIHTQTSTPQDSLFLYVFTHCQPASDYKKFLGQKHYDLPGEV